METEGTLLAFRLAPYDRDKASELVKRLYGQATSSHGGKYVYRRKGLLDEILNMRPIRDRCSQPGGCNCVSHFGWWMSQSSR